MESKVLEIISRYKDGDTLSIQDSKEIAEYCKNVECQKCILRRKFGKCPIGISLA